MRKMTFKALLLIIALAFVAPVSVSAQQMTKQQLAMQAQKMLPAQKLKKMQEAEAQYPLLFKAKSEKREALKQALMSNGRELKGAKQIYKAPRSFRSKAKATAPRTAAAAEMIGAGYDYAGDAEYQSLVSISTSNSAVATTIAAELTDAYGDFMDAGYGSAIVDGKFHGIYLDDSYSWIGIYFFYHYTVDLETGAIDILEESTSGFFQYMASATTQDYGSGTVYGVFYNEEASGLEFGTINYETMERTVINPNFELYFVALGITKDGKIYGIAEDNNFYEINKTTGETTLIGATGLNIFNANGQCYFQSGQIDQKSGTFYLAYRDVDSGAASLQTINLATGAATKVGNLPSEKYSITGMQIPTPAAEDGAPDFVENLKANFSGAKLAGTLSFTIPTKTFGGADLADANLFYYVYVNGENKGAGSTHPGNNEEHYVNVASSGMYQFTVSVKNDVGEGPKQKLTCWVGYDVPKDVTNVKLTGDEEGNITLTWDAVTEGVHAGFMDEVKYNVYRIVGEDQELVSMAQTATEFTEKLDLGDPTNYIYGVEAINGDQTGAMTMSNGMVVGNAYKVPVSFAFDSEESLDLWQVIDANNDGKVWKWYSATYGAYITYNSSKAADDYLVSPAVKLQKGKKYNISFQMGAYSAYYPERGEVLIGKGTSVSDLTGVLLAPTDFTTSGLQDFTVEYTAPESGNYNIAFHGISDADEFYLFANNLSIEKGVEPTAPLYDADEVNLVVEPAAVGEMKATITFNIPTKAINGKNLDPNESINYYIYRNDKTNPHFVGFGKPGASVTHVDTDFDENDDPGTYTYYLRFANNRGRDFSAWSDGISFYIGEDIPMNPENGKLADYKFGVTEGLRLTWDAVGEVGQNGGYVNVDSVYYSVYTVEDGYLGEEVYNGQKTSYLHKGISINEGPQDLFQLALAAENEVGNSGYMGVATVIGAPYTLRFHEGFNSSTGFETFGYISSGVGSFTLSSESSDEDNSSIQWTASSVGTGLLSLGKVTLKGATNPQMVFNYMVTPGDDMTITPTFRLSNGDNVDLDPIDVKNLVGAGASAQWFKVMIDLAQFKNEDYIIPQFKYTVNSITTGYAYAVNIDDVTIDDVLEYDLAIDADAPAKIKKGETIPVTLTVFNDGMNTIDKYTVTLFAGDAIIATMDMTDPIASFTKEKFTYEVPTSIFDEGAAVYMQGKVETQYDLNPDNNSVEFETAFKANTHDPVFNLAATWLGLQNPDLKLEWEAAQAGQLANITEDFEGAEAWAMDTPYNGFTFVSNDAGYAAGIFNNYTLPFEGYNFAYTVWDSEEVNSSDGSFSAHSGSKSLCATYKVNAAQSAYVSNDSWVISPILPGIAQTIKFWVKSASTDYLDTYKVLYSTTGNSLSDFTVAKAEASAPTSWTEISVDLPAGTTYFAIECTSADGLVFMVDDITYTAAASQSPTSFNVYIDQEFKANTTEKVYISEGTANDVHKYSVTAVYGTEESEPVSIIYPDETADPTSINTVENANQNEVKYDLSGRRTNANKGVMIINKKKVIK